MSTLALTRQTESSHWYTTTGEPCHEQPKADGSGMTPTTLRHARKLNLLPSVTTILKVLDKPALTSWKIEQAVLAVLTTPRLDGEQDDAFTKRVLSVDKEQDAERDAAAKLGTDIHAAIELALRGCPYDPALTKYVDATLKAVSGLGEVVEQETVAVGDGYAGRFDVVFGNTEGFTMVDFKSCKRIPKDAYTEHKLQLAAYAKTTSKQIGTANVYISTTVPGEVALCMHEGWAPAYEAFEHLKEVWCWINGYRPKQ